MWVAAYEQRPGGAVRGTVLDDGPGDRQNVGPVECSIQCRAAVTGRAERHLLSDVTGIGFECVRRRDQMRQIDEVFGLGRLTGTQVGHHGYQFRLCPTPPGLRDSGVPPYAANRTARTAKGIDQWRNTTIASWSRFSPAGRWVRWPVPPLANSPSMTRRAGHGR